MKRPETPSHHRRGRRPLRGTVSGRPGRDHLRKRRPRARSFLRSRRMRPVGRAAPGPRPRPPGPPRGDGDPSLRRVAWTLLSSLPPPSPRGRAALPRQLPSGGEQDGPSSGYWAPPVANRRPPRRAALEMAAQLRAPHVPGETPPQTAAPQRGSVGPEPPLSPRAAAGREHRWKKRIDRAAAHAGEAGAPVGAPCAPPPHGGGGLTAGRLPAHGAAAVGELLPGFGAPRRSPPATGFGGARAPGPLRTLSASPRYRRRLGGTRRCASRRAEGAAPPLTETPPPARPHLELALPPRAAGAPASPAARPTPRPAAVPLVPGPAEGQAASPRPRRPAAAAAPLAPTAGKGYRRLSGGRRGAAGGQSSAPRLGLR